MHERHKGRSDLGISPSQNGIRWWLPRLDSKRAGDQSASRAAYELAIDSGHLDAAPKAAFGPGRWRRDGELDAALAA